MKNAKKIGNIGTLLLILGSALYVVELILGESWPFIMVISAVYIVALVLMFIGWMGTKDERRAAKEAAKAEKKAKKEAA